MPSSNSASSRWRPLGLTVLILSGCRESTPSMDKDLRSAIALPHPHHPASARLTETAGKGVVKYLGLDLEPEGHLTPGTELRLTHYLQVEHVFDQDQLVQVELVDPGGRILFQGAHPPVEGRAPARRWRRGQIWADVHRVRLPEASGLGAEGQATKLEIFVRLVPERGGAELSVSRAGARVRAAQVRMDAPPGAAR